VTPNARTDVIGFGGLDGLWFLVAAWQISRWITRDLGAAVTPVPTPPEIAVQLEAEWGRAPYFVEVAAVHQMLTSRCTEAAAMTALTYVFIRHLAEEAKVHR